MSRHSLRPTTPLPVSPALPPGERRVLGLFNHIKRISPAEWPARMLVRAYFSDVTLDLRPSALPAVCVIDVSAWFAEVTIVVPDDVHVDFDLYTMMAEAKDGRRNRPNYAMLDSPRVVITGSAHLAEVKLRVQPR